MGRALQVTDRHGREVVVVVAKLTLAVSPMGDVAIAIPPSAVRFYPEAYESGGVRYPADVSDEKPGTDVILVGHATPGPASKATSMQVRVRVGPLAAAVRVVGPRFWLRNARQLVLGPSAGLVPTPLSGEMTFGAAEPVQSAPAPTIEDLERPGQSASLGAVEMSSPLRTKYLGTMDAAWARERAPLLPTDFDPRFHSCASPGLWSSAPLLGDEAVEVIGATDSGSWLFRLPRFAPRFVVHERDREPEELDTHLDTFLIDAEHGRVELTWRAKVSVPNKAARLQKIAIFQGHRLPEELYRRALQDIDRAATKEATT